MMKSIRYIGLLILLLLTGQLAAQAPVLDSVCPGAERRYRVDGEAGSTYSWILTPPSGTPEILISNADTIEINWSYPAGIYELTCIQHGLNGCDAEAVNGQVIILESPVVDAGPDDLLCIGRYYKLIDATAAYCSSIYWTTSGDGTFDDPAYINATYDPGPNDILAGTVTLTLTGYGLIEDGGCGPSVSTITLTIVDEIVPLFEPIGPLCVFSTPPLLPDTSLQGMTGNWLPPVISTDVLGTFPYTFYPDDPADCGVDTTILITITDEIVPQFEPIGPLCINITPPALPDTSLEGITGTWDPPVISTDVEGTFTYIFTPDDPSQCGVQTMIDISVVTEILPLFDPIGPLCQYMIPPALPDESLNGIAGTWDPPVIVTDPPGTYTYTFTPGPDECGIVTSVDIIILPQVVPEFEPIGPLCQYTAAPPLPGISLNGITGTWDPAWISTAMPGNFSFTFTPDDPGQCGIETTILVIILPELVAEFDPIGPLCQFSAPPVLPEISLNGITGTWDPPVISTDVPGTFFFTFTPDPSYECAMQVTITVIVISDITPTFETIGPLCQNSTPPPLPGISIEGITGSWNPPFIYTDLPGTYSYVFTPDDGQCAVITSIEIEITDEIVPEFDPIGPICQNSIPPLLPPVSTNGITGTWDPATIDTGTPGTFTFTFTPDNPEQCGVETQVDITITTFIVPAFDPIGPLCQGTEPPDLPDVSVNGIQGTWVPLNIDTSVPGTFTFTFIPDDAEENCAVETSIDIIITEEIATIFDPIGPLCQGATAPVLPAFSGNTPAITGTWEPPVIDTSTPGISSYTFTPDPGQCGTEFVMQIEVTEEITAEFDPIGPLCQSTIAPVLPASSLNGITGTWEPAVINTDITGISNYTFTPDEGQCAGPTIISIEVIERVIPLFDPIGPLNQNTTPPLLPSISLNGISGTWNPPQIDTSIPGTYTYVFTPLPGECALVTDMEITVLFDYLDAITGAGKHCLGDAAIVPVEVDKFHSVSSFQLKLSYNVDKLLCEGYVNAHPMLASQLSGWVDQVNGIVTLQWQDVTPVTFPGLEIVCELVFTPKEPGFGQLQWYTGESESYFHDLNGQDIPAEFFTNELEIYNPPEIILQETRNACEGDTLTLIGIASATYPPLSYQWTLPDGTIQSGDPYLANVGPADEGDYTLLVTDAMGCTDQKSIRLVVSGNPVASFHGSDTLMVPEDYLLEAGSGMAAYLWNTGETTESIIIDSTGLYSVELLSTVGCFGTDSVYVFVIIDEIPSECMFVPNAFTPNADGLNDIFVAVSGCELDLFRMEIFNRWGELIYKANDISLGWDGKKNGVPCPGDAYVYKIAYRPSNIPADAPDMVKVGVIVIVQ